MKIVCIASDPVIDQYLTPLEKIGELTIYHKQNLTEDEVVELVGDAEVLITGPEATGDITSSMLDRFTNLKLLSLLTIGYNWVDVKHATGKGITISNIKGATAESVAEHTWAMILDLSKRITEFDRTARYDDAYNFSLYKGKEVYGKTLGIVGLGDIGKKVARIAKAFEMKVIGVNKSGKVVEGVELVKKEDLFKQADIIALCVALNDETVNYVGKEEVELTKQGVILVNCAREKLVDKEAVLQGLKSGKIFGYGVEEAIMQKIAKDDPYYQHQNIIVVPHNAFNTVEADTRSYKLVAENILAFEQGRPQNLVLAD